MPVSWGVAGKSLPLPLLGEMEVTEDPATVAAIVAEVRKTQLRFGAMPLGEGVYRLVVPAEGVAKDRSVPPTLEEFKQQSRAPTSARTHRAGSPASATPPGWPSATGPAGCCWPVFEFVADASGRAERVVLEDVGCIGKAGAAVLSPGGDVGGSVGIVDLSEPYRASTGLAAFGGGLDDDDVGALARIQAVGSPDHRDCGQLGAQVGELGCVVEARHLGRCAAAAAAAHR